MRDILSIIVFVGILFALANVFAPLIIVALVCGFIYTAIQRFKIKKVIRNEEKIMEEFQQFEEPKRDLEIIEAEVEEKTR